MDKLKIGHRYWSQADLINHLTTAYYESCFDDLGDPLNPNESNTRRRSAADNLLWAVKDLFEEAMGVEVKIELIHER